MIDRKMFFFFCWIKPKNVSYAKQGVEVLEGDDKEQSQHKENCIAIKEFPRTHYWDYHKIEFIESPICSINKMASKKLYLNFRILFVIFGLSSPRKIYYES